MRQHFTQKNLAALIVVALAWIGILFLLPIGYNECLLNGEESRCHISGINLTKVRLNDYYCKLAQYQRACGVFPNSNQGLKALLKPPTSPPLCASYPEIPMISKKEVPADGFGNAFVYESDGKQFDVYSLGRSHTRGGAGDNFNYGVAASVPPVSLLDGRVLLYWIGIYICS